MADVVMQEAEATVKDEAKQEVASQESTTNGAGEEKTETVAPETEYADNEDFKKLVELSIKPGVAAKMMKLLEDNIMTMEEIDARVVELLNSFPEDQGKYVVEQMHDAMLFGVQNKAQFLMSLMRNFREKVRAMGIASAMTTALVSGPNRDKMKEILDRTGYNLEITVGQRKYGGPPPDWEGPITGPVGQGHEIYIGHVPHELFEDSLVPLFEQCGKIWDLRLMMDPVTMKNRGYAFLTYCEKQAAADAAKKYDGHEISPGKTLKVNVSVANTRLFLGNIPKSKTKDEILEELKKHTEGVTDVILHLVPDATDRHKNRGFCFVDFVDHKAASDAKRRIQQHKVRPFNCELVVDWAEQQDEPDEETMSKVKVLYVRGLKEAVSEEKLKEIFGPFGEIERVKKQKDYAFVHYKEREDCLKALEEMNGKELEGNNIECSLAKPQTETKKKRFQQQPGGRGRGMGYGSPMGGYGGPPMRGGRGGAYPNQGYGDYYSGGGWNAGYGGYEGGYDGYGGGYGGPGAYGGYDSGYAGGYGAPQGPPGRGGYGGPGPYGGGGWGGPRGGGGPRGRGGPGGRGGGFFNRGGKRPGDRSGGPASKRDNGAPDFSADVNMASF